MGVLTSFGNAIKRRRLARGHTSIYESVGDNSNVLRDAESEDPDYAITEAEWGEAQRKNSRTEPYYREWCVEIVTDRKEAPLRTLIDGGAEKFQCSPTTTRRYLAKLTSDFGPLQLERNDSRRWVVTLRD